MQQRRLRLGDIVDDYCPRERRITNHAVVAMVADEIKRTRCTTCDAEHEYKQAKVPAQRRRKDAPATLTADLPPTPPRKHVPVEARAGDEPAEPAAAMPHAAAPPAGSVEPAGAPAEALIAEAGAAEAQAEPEPMEDDGPVHRPLIRATLPRPEGQVPERKIPEFTAHQRGLNGNRQGRGPRRAHRQGQARGHQPGNSAGPTRFGTPRHGQTRSGPAGQQRHFPSQGQRPGGGRQGQRSGQGGGPQRPGGRKRGR